MTLTDAEAVELAQLEAEFELAGGRGVDLAERIDLLRVKRDAARLTIDVSGSGAVLEGTTRDDAQAIKDLHDGWKWSRNLGAWYLPRSLTHPMTDVKVRRLQEAFDEPVEIIGGDQRETDEERAERRYERDKELVGVHEQRSEKAAAEAQGHYDEYRKIADMIPLGQPILVGHHSERRHRKDLERIDRNLGKSAEASRESTRQERLADAAAHRVAETDRRKRPDEFGPHNVGVGDMIHTPWQDQLVLRVSAKSVTVPSFISGIPYTDTLSYRKIQGVIALSTPESRQAVKDALAKVKAHRKKHAADQEARVAEWRARTGGI